jgi:MFS family permease
VTVIIAIIGYFILPASPDKAMFLTERERWIALARIEAEHKEAASEKTQLKHVRLALFNVNTIVCAAGFFLTNVSVTSISYFLPTILANLGWTATKAQLYSVPPYVVACCWQVALSYISDRYKRRGLSVFFCAVLVIIGYSLLRDLAPAKYRYLGTFFAAAGAFPLGPALLSWVLNNNAGPNIRSIASAAIVAVGLNGAITATWTYRESDGPRYIHGHTINLITSTMLAALSLFGIAYIRWENQQRAAGKRDYRLQKFQGESGGAEQLLGSRHPAFRYME